VRRFQASKALKERVIKLAAAGNKAKQIGERLGLKPDHVLKMLSRAERDGLSPAGTVQKATEVKAKPVETKPIGPIQVYAPQRKVASEMGSCSFCSSPVEVVIDATEGKTTTRTKLCVSHAPDLYVALGEAMVKASAGRVAFNGKFRS
jgi:hypothetical protein